MTNKELIQQIEGLDDFEFIDLVNTIICERGIHEDYLIRDVDPLYFEEYNGAEIASMIEGDFRYSDYFMCYTMDKHQLISSNNPRDLCIFTNEEIADFLTHNKKIADMFGILI